ncbi:Zinc finger protein 830 [Frankliniella fusca]|uniref:Zinc finger protein 830 n=1 Tax=Frankliniella fusca TaxID=407009 RepID=A0AAE1HW95_9NEOP|nr:Zinc finger protein 830 [Frankliniella fusca]
MATLKASKRKVSQEELRRLMSKHKDKFVESVKKIDSPLAKYTSDGTLMCVLCNTVVRSEAVWNVHINAKAHRDNIHLAKQKKISSEFKSPAIVASPALKRPNEPVKNDPIPSKKLKGILKNAPVKTPSSTSLPDNFFDGNSVSSGGHNQSSVVLSHIMETTDVCEPMDEDNVNGDNPPNSGLKEEALPEGFFDDPIMDAKARHVEYKDPIEEEWEKFQKEIKEEVTVSSQIIEEDHEEATAERQIEEIDEQLRNWNRVLELERKKEAVKAAERIKMEIDEDISSGEDDFDEFLDWRSKKSFR